MDTGRVRELDLCFLSISPSLNILLNMQMLFGGEKMNSWWKEKTWIGLYPATSSLSWYLVQNSYLSLSSQHPNNLLCKIRSSKPPLLTRWYFMASCNSQLVVFINNEAEKQNSSFTPPPYSDGHLPKGLLLCLHYLCFHQEKLRTISWAVLVVLMVLQDTPCLIFTQHFQGPYRCYFSQVSLCSLTS